MENALEEYEKDRNEKALLMALRKVAKAKDGISVLAEKTNISRESLYKTLSHNGNPRLKTLQSILESFGFVLTFKFLKTV